MTRHQIKFMEEFNRVAQDYELITPYVNNNTPIRVKHKKYGVEFQRAPRYFLDNPEFPYIDETINDTKNTEWFRTQVDNLGVSQYKVLDEYQGINTKIRIQHSLCGYIYNDSPKNFISGKRCPICNNYHFKGVSEDEKKILAFIKTLNVEYKENERFYLDSHKFLELDIYLPKHKLGIEFNGLYWHSEKYKENDYHSNKTKFFKSKGIRVVHVFEDEWIHNEEIVKSLLEEIIQPKSSKLNTVVKPIEYRELREFMLNNHVKGYCVSDNNLGLFAGNELISALSYKIEGKVAHIKRYAHKVKTEDGLVKLMNYIENNSKVKEIAVNEDVRWSDESSNIYIDSGFKLTGFVEPNYYYVYGNKRHKRYSFKKSNLKKDFPEFYDENLTEEQIMDKTKYFRIWDCGRYVFSKKIK